MFTLNTHLNKDSGPQLSPEGVDNGTHPTSVPLHEYVDPTSGSFNMNKPVYNSQIAASHVESSMV